MTVRTIGSTDPGLRLNVETPPLEAAAFVAGDCGSMHLVTQKGHYTVTGYVKGSNVPPHPQRVESTPDDRRNARHFLERIGGMAVPLLKGETQEAIYVQGAFDPNWAAGLWVPVDISSQDQPVTLIEPKHATTITDPEDLRRAYKNQPRTQVRIGTERLGGWHEELSRQLGQWVLSAPSEASIVCAIYQSEPHDETFGDHMDLEPAVIMQQEGEKERRSGILRANGF